MTGEAEVLQLTNTLSSEHLQQALDLLATSKKHHDAKWRPSDDEEGVWPNKTSHLYTLSTIMHSFAALEGHVNRIAHAILREPEFRTSSLRRTERSSLKISFRNGMGISQSKRKRNFYSVSDTQPILVI